MQLLELRRGLPHSGLRSARKGILDNVSNSRRKNPRDVPMNFSTAPHRDARCATTSHSWWAGSAKLW